MGLFNVAGWASGANWWKIGAYALIVAILVGGGYFYGKYNCEQAHLKEKVVQAEEKTRTIVKEVEVRVPVVQVREVESAKQKAEIVELQRKLRNAQAKRPENPSCDLSDDEFNSMRDLAAKTHAAK